MAYDYEKVKKQYESLNDQQKQSFANDTSGNVQDFLTRYNAEKNQSSNAASTPVNKTTTTTTNTGTSNVAKPEYQGTGTTGVKSSPYTNQGAGNYTYNAKTGYYEKQSTPTNAGTSTGATQTSTPTSSNASIRDEWNNKSYQEQQDLLNKNPGLREKVNSIGGDIKTSPEEVTPTTPKTDTTKPGSEWDYQDNSPERMQQIADNLERMYQSNPGLFANEQTFRDFFINGVNRTPEQEKFLMDYYRNRKVYNEYDGYTSEAVGGMYAYGKVPESYLNYVKNSNPQRYAEIMDAKDKEQAKIKNNSSYDSILEQNGFESTNNLDWQKREGLLVDKNNDLIDDRLYHEPTEEERQKVDRINEIDARMLEINNALKWAEEDLTKAYPGATKATIMALVNDRSQNLLREKDDLMVERTQLAGTVDYLQNERQNEDKAGQQTIANLQKNLGMYYTYSPEGMSELAQAQYAATNVTLDQADNGTDTQKQIALDSVLSDYFDKYGSIIQRSKSQVINDVMNYAKKNGVSLSQALEDNFLKELRRKPGFAELNTISGTSPKVSFEKVGDTGYVFTVNPDGTYSIDTVSGITGTGVGTMRTERNNNPTAMTTDVAKSLGLVEGVDYVQGDKFPDSNLYTAKLLGDPIETTIKALDNGANSSSTHAFYTAGGKQRWTHTAMSDEEWLKLTPEQKQQVVLGMLQKEGGDINKMTYYNDGSNGGSNTSGYDPLLKEFFQKDPTKLTKDQWAKLKNMGYDERTYLSMRQNYLSQLAKEPDDATVKILDTLGYLMTNYPGRASLMAGRGTKYLPGEYGEKMGDYRSYVDYIKQNLTMDNLTKLKANGATFGSLTEGEWPRIEASATRLQDTMSEDKFVGELLDIYNTYAKNAGMGTLTLDDINQMYGGKSSGVSLNAPSFIQSGQSTNIQGGDIDYDARLAEYSG